MKKKMIACAVMACALAANMVAPAMAASWDDSATPAVEDAAVNPLDTGKEILYYLFWTSDDKLEADVIDLQSELLLSDQQLEALKELGLKEHLACQTLNETYSSNSRSSIDTFNAVLDENTQANKQEMQEILGDKTEDFRDWISSWWEEERQYRMNANVMEFSDVDRISKVWATQYSPDTSGAVEVALPDKYVKFANLGWEIPSAFKNLYDNPPYTVNVFNPENSKTLNNVEVNDVGPWNENDNYWDRDRRKFDDLDVGVSEAYAAYYDDYNNGKDEFGRKVTNPAGIDLSTKAASRLGFSKNGSGFVDVRYEYLP